MNKNDEDLILDYLSGKDFALKTLVDKYTPVIFNFVTRFVGISESSDITQDIFIKVWKNIKKFDSKKSSFKTWIFTIARNTIFDYLRKRKSIVFSELNQDEKDFIEGLESVDDWPSEYVQRIQDKDFLEKILSKLGADYREVLVLHYQEEMTFTEIAQILNKSINTVKSHHRRALIKLRKLINY